MRTIPDSTLATIQGGIDEGAVCGAMVGLTVGLTFLVSPLAGALAYMFTPAACALDYGLR